MCVCTDMHQFGFLWSHCDSSGVRIYFYLHSASVKIHLLNGPQSCYGVPS